LRAKLLVAVIPESPAPRGLIGGDRCPALLNGGDYLNDIALADLVDAPAGPGLANLPAKEPSDLAPGTVLRQTLRYEGLQQIFDSVCHDTAMLPSLHIGSTADEMTGSNVICRPHSRKKNQRGMNRQPSTSISGKQHPKNARGEGAATLTVRSV